MSGPQNPKSKEYIMHTEMSDDRYPMYRQRAPDNGGNKVDKYKNVKLYIK